MDTNNHGVLINGAGKFTMRYTTAPVAGATIVPPEDFAGVTTPAANTWYHLMVVRPRGPNNGSVMYVNGVAEAAATGPYRGEDVPNDEIAAANQDNSPLVIGSNTAEAPGQLAIQSYFRGIVDDLEMFVMGLNNTRDLGEFQFDRDNKYAAFFEPTTQGDVAPYDNQITMTDVTAFASHWLQEPRR